MIQPIESFSSQYSSVPRLKTLTLIGGAVQRDEDRVDAILYVEIGLALACRCRARVTGTGRAQASVEIEHMAVRVALAEDRDEPEDPRLESRTLRSRPGSVPRPPASTRRRVRSAREMARAPGVGITAASP